MSTTLFAGWLIFLLICSSPPTPAPTGEPEPVPDDGLPRYDEPISLPIVDPPALREVPNDGRGMLAAGGTLMGFAGATLVGGIVLATNDHALQQDWVPLILVAAVGATAGSMLLGWGVPKRREYRAWEAKQPDVIPRPGLGLIGSGTTLMVLGVFGVVFSASVWQDETDPLAFTFDPHPERVTAAKVGIGLGVSSFAVGTSLLVTGAGRHKRFGAWRGGPTARLAPILAPTRSGLHIGLAGRF